MSAVEWLARPVALAALLAGAVLVRLYGVTFPLVDSLHQRQTQTAMVARNLYRDLFVDGRGLESILMTRYDQYGPGPGYAILEFPLYNAIVALLYATFGVHETLGRLVSVAASVATVALLHRLASRLLTPPGAVVAAGVYAFSMTAVFMGRAFMPEALLLLLVVASAEAFHRWIERPTPLRLALAGALAAAGFLVKSPAALQVLPLVIMWWSGSGARAAPRRLVGILAFLALALLPLFLWTRHASAINRAYSNEFAPGLWLSNRLTDVATLLDWRTYDALARSAIALVTPVGLVLVVAGVWATRRDARFRWVHAWLVAWLAFVVAFLGLNAGHPYYQLPLLPAAGILIGRGAEVLWAAWSQRGAPAQRSAAVVAGAVAVALVAQVAAYVYYVPYSYDLTRRVPDHLQVAQFIRENTPPNATLALADLNTTNTTLTYYADRKSWPYAIPDGAAAVGSLEGLRANGATVLVALDTQYHQWASAARSNTELWEHLVSRYTPLAIEDRYVIFDLHERADRR